MSNQASTTHAELALPTQGPPLVTSSGLIRLQVGDNELRLLFSAAVTTPAASLSGLDQWTVQVQASGSAYGPATFTHATPAHVSPHPHRILSRVASDVTLAMAMPAAIGPALDWLFDEGYATMPSDALTLWQSLVSVRKGAELLLEGSGISLADFAAHAASLPIVGLAQTVAA